MVATTTFVTQLRTYNPDGSLAQDWTQACHGHDQEYAAITCFETGRALMNGTIEPTNELELMTYQTGARVRMLKLRLEWRILKRTVTEEVVETTEAAKSDG